MGAAVAQMPAVPDLTAQLGQAQEKARRLREAATIAENKFRTAITEERFTDAETLKSGIQPAHAEALLAEAHARAIADVLEQARREHDERERAEEAARAVEVAREGHARAVEAEQAAMDTIQAHWAEAMAGIDAVRESLRAAVAAEGTALQARSEAFSCLVTLGEREPGTRITGPNYASARIAASRVLDHIYRGLTL